MATTEITGETFSETVESDGIVLVDFWASWCQPCLRFAPIYDAVSDQHDDVTFAKVDTQAEQELAAQAGIQAIPTLMAFRDGILVFNQAGALDESQLSELVDSVKGLDMDEVRAKIDAQ